MTKEEEEEKEEEKEEERVRWPSADVYVLRRHRAKAVICNKTVYKVTFGQLKG